MKKVALYPFDKITRGLVKFRDLLDFEIGAVIDFMFNTGEDAGENAEGITANIPILKEVELALEGMDALIINSMGEPIFFEKDKELYRQYEVDKKWKAMVKYAYDRGIEIISIHDVINPELQQWLADNNIYLTTYSKTDEEILELIEEGRKVESEKRAHRIAIYATRGCVGKYTTQLHMLRAMKKAEKNVAAIITEPVGNFYGQYDGDPLRFRMVKDPLRYVYYMETLAKRADAEGYEYLLMADQQSLTTQFFIEEPACKISWLKAYQPDTIILVAGYEDDDRIRDCIDIFRIYGNGKKPVAVLIPDRMEVDYGIYEVIDEKDIESRKEEIKSKFGIEHVEVVRDIELVMSKIIC